jgi:hypothetical protein
MYQYYETRPSATIAVPANVAAQDVSDDTAIAPVLSEFDKHRETLLTADAEEGWASELRRYLGIVQRDIKKDTDLVEWWQVSRRMSLSPIGMIFYLHILIEPCTVISYPRSHRTRRASGSSISCSL